MTKQDFSGILEVTKEEPDSHQPINN